MDNPNESITPTKLKGQRVARDTHCRTIPILWFGSKQLCMDYNVPLSRSLLTYIIIRGSQKVCWTMLKRLFVFVLTCWADTTKTRVLFQHFGTCSPTNKRLEVQPFRKVRLHPSDRVTLKMGNQEFSKKREWKAILGSLGMLLLAFGAPKR